MQRLLRALLYSLEGLRDSFKTEPAFRQEIFLAIILIPAAFFLESSPTYRILMVSSILLVLIAEIANTAIEAAINRISTEIHPLSKKAKDAGSALVLLALLNVALVWGIILLR
jgi:diacylglycerol kinase (ATP)